MGGLGSGEWMPTTFVAVAADAAVLVYLSILDAPGMGGRGQGDREGWVGWHLGSGCRQLLSQLLRGRSCSRLSFNFGCPWDGRERTGGREG